MEKITLPKSTFDNLFDHILSVNFAETWNMYETDSERINPYVVFETAKWDKLLSLLNIYINKNDREFDNNTTELDLIVGGFLSLKYRLDLYLKRGFPNIDDALYKRECSII